MFLQRQKLDVGKAHLRNVVRERLRHFAISKRRDFVSSSPGQAGSLSTSPPRAEVHFVDRKRPAKMFAAGRLFHPLVNRET